MTATAHFCRSVHDSFPSTPWVHNYVDQHTILSTPWAYNYADQHTLVLPPWAHKCFDALGAQLCWSARDSFCALRVELRSLAHKDSDALSAQWSWSVQNSFDTPRVNFYYQHTIILTLQARNYADQHTILLTLRAQIIMISTRLFWHPERTIMLMST